MSGLRTDKQLAFFLKGLAILAVVGLHLLTLLPSSIYFSNSTQLAFLSFDQLLRFCVPVFIFLSGYGLSLKYQTKALNLVGFYRSRIIKLLPLYLLWSAYYLFLSEFIEPWWKVLQTGPIWKILLLGWSDYHLYFISVIFQLYLLYPLLLKLIKSFPKTTLALSLLTQLGLYAYFSVTNNPPPDQIQNTLFLSWIFYFVLGIFLAGRKSFLSQKAGFLIAVFGLILSIFDTHQYLNSTQSLILAIRSTKISQLLYSFGFITFFLNRPQSTSENKLINWLGKNSFLIYLSHPVLIHLANFNPTEIPILQALLSFIIMLFISIKIEHLQKGVLFARKP
jgi:probable poly-beta-1,6-N-acetyl-D-glucosamine export protein